MASKRYQKRRSKKQPLPLRHSVIIWAGGAILGWLVAVASVWLVLNNNTETEIAQKQFPDTELTPEEVEKLEQIMPAAGDPNQSDKQDTSNSDNTTSTENPEK